MATLKDLQEQLRAREEQLAACKREIETLREQMKHWKTANWIQCSSCRRFKAPEYMSLASSKEVEDWWENWEEDVNFQDEHCNHHGPTEGEWYCGC
jgi:DNA repair exonuclease SbcCD ATPase subunit